MARPRRRSGIKAIEELLGADARALLDHRCKGIPKETLHLPGPDFVDRVFAGSDRPTPVLRSLQQLFGHGRLAGTGYLSILPVDQGIEHSAGASFAKNPAYFDPENIVQARDRGRLQRRGLDLRRAGRGGAQVRPQDPLHREGQPQRVPHLPEQVRPDHVRQREAGRGHGRGRGGRDHLLRLAGVGAADRRGEPGLPGRPRAGPGHDPLVLHAQPRLQEGQGLPRRPPTSPARPTTWA